MDEAMERIEPNMPAERGEGGPLRDEEPRQDTAGAGDPPPRPEADDPQRDAGRAQKVEQIQRVRSVDDKKLSRRESILSWVKTLLAALVLALLIKNFVVVNAMVMSGSMENTIMTGDRVICSRLTYLFGEPERYDVIAFDFYEGAESSIYVKRIIGLPGERIEIIDGKVYVDGGEEPLYDGFINGEPIGDFGPYEVPAGEYFVLGDNRRSSYDSRRWPYSFVPREDILGKAMFSYYPRIKSIAGVEE